MVNEGLVNLLTDDLTAYLKTMSFEHNITESDVGETKNEAVGKVTEKQNEVKASSEGDPVTEQSAASSTEGKCSLFARRKGPLSCKNEDELKVIIERDNMIVGFIDAIDSDASDDSRSEDETTPIRRKFLKRARSTSPKAVKKVFNELL